MDRQGDLHYSSDPSMILMSEFYTIPSGVTHTLVKHTFINGSVLVPFDPDLTLSTELQRHNYTVTTNTDIENITDPNWWVGMREQAFDWVVCSTMGLKDLSEYILEYGMEIATNGIAVLDRLSFIEPVARRRTFLLKNKLSNMVVLSPRPKFRSIGSTKDSVTACWFVFQKPELWRDGTMISYAVNWEDIGALPELPT